jgi:mannobiose 2-epimerase
MEATDKILEESSGVLRIALEKALQDILHFWQTEMPDKENGGFMGAMRHDGKKITEAPKGAVLNARILWTFSTAAVQLKDESLRQSADDAYAYFSSHFFDPVFGGIYWSVDYKGLPLETKKQVYAQGFAMYALSAYYNLTGNEKALQQAIELFYLLEQHSYDPIDGGYFEAFTREWETIEDLRLSDKDANEKKTMNTHLHVLEGYTLLYKMWPDAELRKKIIELLSIFKDKIIVHSTATQGLFFDEKWVRKDTLISFGHDIEASWLLQEAAEALHDDDWIAYTKDLSVKMAHAALKGIDSDGGMWHEYDVATHHLVKEKHWWPQAEAMVGYYNAWQNSGDPIFREQVHKSWNFISQHLIDKQYSEWIWGVYEDYSSMSQEDFAGFWKCPYHNGRACMELLNRLEWSTLN